VVLAATNARPGGGGAPTTLAIAGICATMAESFTTTPLELWPGHALTTWVCSSASAFRAAAASAPELVEATKGHQIATISCRGVVDEFQVLVAANRAMYARSLKKMKTKHLADEILYRLSPSNNITKALQTFGADASADDAVLLAVFDASPALVEGVCKALSGALVTPPSTSSLYDMGFVAKVYGLSEPEQQDPLGPIVSRIAVKAP